MQVVGVNLGDGGEATHIPTTYFLTTTGKGGARALQVIATACKPVTGAVVRVRTHLRRHHRRPEDAVAVGRHDGTRGQRRRVIIGSLGRHSSHILTPQHSIEKDLPRAVPHSLLTCYTKTFFNLGTQSSTQQ